MGGGVRVGAGWREERATDTARPPLSAHTTPVPAQAIHVRKPLRSMPSCWWSWWIYSLIASLSALLLDDDCAVHERVNAAVVGERAGLFEHARKVLVGIQGLGRPSALGARHPVRIAVLVLPDDTRAPRDYQPTR